MFKKSLALRVLAVCFLVLALPLLVSTFIFFNHAYDQLIDRANRTLESASLYRTLTLQEMSPVEYSFLKELKYLLKLEKEISTLPNQTFNQRMIKLTRSINELQVFVLDAGRDNHYQFIASSVDNLIGTIFESNARLQKVANDGKGNFVRYHYSERLKKAVPYLYSGIPIYDPLIHLIQGFLIVRDDILAEQNQLLQPFQESDLHIHFAVVDMDDGQFIQAATDSKLEGQYFQHLSKERQNQLLLEYRPRALNFFAEHPLPTVKNPENPNLFEFKWNGEVQLASLTSTNETGIGILAYMPKKQIFAEALNRFLIIYIVFGLIIFLGGTFIYYLTRWMSRPLEQILKLMQKVQLGNLNVRYKPEKLGFELNFLGNVFNETMNSFLYNMHSAERVTIKKETLQKELNIAKSVQKGLLPKKIPQIEGIELVAFGYIGNEVSGDFYDFFVNDDNLYVICSDAHGVGLSSCLYALTVRSSFRAYGQMHSDAAELMRLVNNTFCDDTKNSGMFVTAIMVVYHIQSKVLTYYCAGHVPGIIQRKNGEVIMLKKRAMALGIIKSDKYEATSLILEKGDILLFYTDGLIDATNDKQQKFSEQRLQDLLHKRNWNSAQEVIDGIVREVNEFVDQKGVKYEFVIVAMKVKDQ